MASHRDDTQKNKGPQGRSSRRTLADTLMLCDSVRPNPSFSSPPPSEYKYRFSLSQPTLLVWVTM
ncbi:hypothetical protein ACRRTK_004748 [Alexandromys fortis]